MLSVLPKLRWMAISGRYMVTEIDSTDVRFIGSAKHPHPIYSLSVFGTKIHIVNSSKLVMAVNRNPKSLAFRSLGMKLTTRLLGPSKEATALALENAGGEQGDWGLTIAIVREVHKGMAPGVDLDRMSASAVHTLSAALQCFESATSTRINLFEWLRHAMTQATTDSVYGPMNPFNDPEVENAFWWVFPLQLWVTDGRNQC